MVFCLESKEVRPEGLIRLNAGNGEFYVCSAGAGREVDQIIFYGDDFNQFFFYANWLSKTEDSRDIEIFSASTDRLRGGPPTIQSNRIDIIKKNIEFLFRNRRFYLIDRLIIQSELPENIIFTWNISK